MGRGDRRKRPIGLEPLRFFHRPMLRLPPTATRPLPLAGMQLAVLPRAPGYFLSAATHAMSAAIRPTEPRPLCVHEANSHLYAGAVQARYAPQRACSTKQRSNIESRNYEPGRWIVVRYRVEAGCSCPKRQMSPIAPTVDCSLNCNVMRHIASWKTEEVIPVHFLFWQCHGPGRDQLCVTFPVGVVSVDWKDASNGLVSVAEDYVLAFTDLLKAVVELSGKFADVHGAHDSSIDSSWTAPCTVHDAALSERSCPCVGSRLLSPVGYNRLFSTG